MKQMHDELLPVKPVFTLAAVIFFLFFFNVLILLQG